MNQLTLVPISKEPVDQCKEVPVQAHHYLLEGASINQKGFLPPGSSDYLSATDRIHQFQVLGSSNNVSTTDRKASGVFLQNISGERRDTDKLR